MTDHIKPSGKEDPRSKYERPPYPQDPQIPPGLESEMEPCADHGETSYRGTGRLEGKAAIVTGGDSGIGRAIAIAYAREGCDLALSYLSEHVDAKETRRWVEQAGRKALELPGDIQVEANCKTIVDRCMEEFGRIDILINNAAYQTSHSSIQDITSQEFDRAFKTNVYSMFYLCKFCLPLMKPGSVIINTASIQAYHPSGELLHYAATKGAIVNFTKGLTQEAAGRGIRVNAVAPGPVWTPLIPSTLPIEKTREFGKETALGRAAQPAELAPIYVFLATTDSSYITGEIVGVTGGKFLS